LVNYTKTQPRRKAGAGDSPPVSRVLSPPRAYVLRRRIIICLGPRLLFGL